MSLMLPHSWQSALGEEVDKSYWKNLSEFVTGEYSKHVCFPEKDAIFRALALVPFHDVKVIIIGQDPYHTPGVATGVSFSVPEGMKTPPSIKNIFKELLSDTGKMRTCTDLTDWTHEGVLLLNTVLTVRAHLPGSHSGQGWEIFTDEVIRLLSDRREYLVFILWGNHAISKAPIINATKHLIITSSHPSPFSARKSFFGSRPFSRTNDYLDRQGIKKILW